MRTWAYYLVAAAIGLNTGVSAAPKPTQFPKLRYSDEYTRYRCELKNLGGVSFEDFLDMGKKVTGDAEKALQERLDAEERLKEQFQSALSSPYPPELQGYRPKSFELVEFLWSADPCSEGRYQNGPTLPASFRCRLDRVILKDHETGEQFSSLAALVDFDFLYEDGDEWKLEDNPRPLPSEPYKTVGVITLKGTVDGMVGTMSHAWMGGSPAETVTSKDWGEEEKKLEFTPAADLPIVTATNASIFSFDLKNETPYIRGEYGGPLKEYSFKVHGCRQ